MEPNISPRALVICVSVSNGNTRKVADAIADVLHADVRAPEEVDPRVLEEYDVIGFGSGIYGMSMHRRLRDLVDRLRPVEGRYAFVFSTSGRGVEQNLPWQRPLAGLLADKGYEVLGTFACRGHDTWLPLKVVGGIAKGHPDAADLTGAWRFADAIARELHPV